MLSSLRISKLDANSVFWILGSIVLVSVFAAIATEAYFLVIIPLFVVGAWICLADYKKIFYLLFISIPLSTDIDLPGGLSLSFISEPLQILLSGILVLLVLQGGKNIPAKYIKHPITIALLLHLAWIVVTVLMSTDGFVSIKYLLAKFWFVLPSYFLTLRLMRSVDDVKQVLWCVLLPLLFTISVILVRHAAIGFSFDGVNYILGPFYSNHVLYASMIAIMFPFVWFMRKWYPTFSFKWWFLAGSFVLMLIGIYLSYTLSLIHISEPTRPY